MGTALRKENPNQMYMEAKRPKLNEEMREDRIKELEEDLTNITSLITFKEKRRSQARNYKVCDDLLKK